MGHLLRRMGVKVEGEVGTVQRFLGVALANIQKPELVVQAHEAYINAGADVITTNSYACIPSCLSLANKEGIDWQGIIRAAGECALKARGSRDVKVAGCIPPLTASYRADLVLSDDALDEQYNTICSNIRPYSDLFLCETMSCTREALAAAKACAKHSTEDAPLPIWVAFTLADIADGTLRSGESVTDAVTALFDLGIKIEAILFNCCSPQSVEVAHRLLLQLNHPWLRDGECQLGGYANGFIGVKHGDAYNEDLTPAKYLECVERWEGSTIVGGCCGVFPEHIAVLREWSDAKNREDKEVEPVESTLIPAFLWDPTGVVTGASKTMSKL